MTVRTDYSNATEPGGGRDPAKFYAIDALEHAQAINNSPYSGFVKPPTTGWADYNIGTGTSSVDNGDQLVTIPADSGVSARSALNLRGRTRSLSPTSNYSAEFYLDGLVPAVSSSGMYWFIGMNLVDSVSGKTILFGIGDTSGASSTVNIVLETQTAASGTGAAVVQDTATAAPYPHWLRIRDNGTTRFYEYSYNHLDWVTNYSEARTTFITPNQIGYVVANANTSRVIVLRFRSMTGIS